LMVESSMRERSGVFYYPFLDGECDPETGLLVRDNPVVAHTLPVEKLAYGISLASILVLLTGLCLPFIRQAGFRRSGSRGEGRVSHNRGT